MKVLPFPHFLSNQTVFQKFNFWKKKNAVKSHHCLYKGAYFFTLRLSLSSFLDKKKEIWLVTISTKYVLIHKTSKQYKVSRIQISHGKSKGVTDQTKPLSKKESTKWSKTPTFIKLMNRTKWPRNKMYEVFRTCYLNP